MANYQLPWTGEQIKAELQQLVNNAFVDVMKGVYPESAVQSDIPTTTWINEQFGGKSEVEYEQIIQRGTRVGVLTINGTPINIYAPSGGGGSSIITWNQLVTSGTKIATITIDDEPTDIYVPNVQSVTGVKGNNESVYRVGNVNITPQNIGAYVKPSTGIPSSDMSSSVQTSLARADSSIQSHQDISGLLPKTGGTMNGGLKANATAVATLSTPQMRNIYAGTEDIGEGATLATGDIYLVYE